MKRQNVSIDEIASYENICLAVRKAVKSKQDRPQIKAFLREFETNVMRLIDDLKSGKAPYGKFCFFKIHDPKERMIHAASFPDRVVHHAIMNLIQPTFERAMTPFSYACRKGMGPVSAIKAVQKNSRMYPWLVKIDIQKYFDSIDHQILTMLLLRKFKGQGIPDLLGKLINCYETVPGKGLPIGTLTSQNFANYYLDGLDRYLTEQVKCRAYIRYMDDMIWWIDDAEAAKNTLRKVTEYVWEQRRLKVKSNSQINRSAHGITFCGYRIFPGTIRLTRRRKKRYMARKKFWENEFLAGRITNQGLQKTFSSVNSIMAHSDSRAWLRKYELTCEDIDV